MKLLIIRHADPDYSIDSLTPTGWEEAELLSQKISKLDVKAFYVSPLGRAQDTASLTLRKMGRTAETCLWLREFGNRIVKPYETQEAVAWDWLPEVWTKEPQNYALDTWADKEVFRNGRIAEEYTWVTTELDRLLQRHGYVRDGGFYRVEHANEDTLVFFCHLGLECVLLSHLLHISPMLLWHGTCPAPSSVTTLVTEERRKGIAHFRMTSFGDTSHLQIKDKAASFSGRFCECYENWTQRHD